MTQKDLASFIDLMGGFSDSTAIKTGNWLPKLVYLNNYNVLPKLRNEITQLINWGNSWVKDANAAYAWNRINPEGTPDHINVSPPFIVYRDIANTFNQFASEQVVANSTNNNGYSISFSTLTPKKEVVIASTGVFVIENTLKSFIAAIGGNMPKYVPVTNGNSRSPQPTQAATQPSINYNLNQVEKAGDRKDNALFNLADDVRLVNDKTLEDTLFKNTTPADEGYKKLVKYLIGGAVVATGLIGLAIYATKPSKKKPTTPLKGTPITTTPTTLAGTKKPTKTTKSRPVTRKGASNRHHKASKLSSTIKM